MKNRIEQVRARLKAESRQDGEVNALLVEHGYSDWYAGSCIGITLSGEDAGGSYMGSYMAISPRIDRSLTRLEDMKQRRAIRKAESAQVFALLKSSGYKVAIDGSDVAVHYKREEEQS